MSDDEQAACEDHGSLGSYVNPVDRANAEKLHQNTAHKSKQEPDYKAQATKNANQNPDATGRDAGRKRR